MYEKLLASDRALFLSLNGDMGTFMDYLMIVFTSKISIAVVIVVSLILLYKRVGRKQFFMIIAAIGLIILFADQTSNFFKHNTPRLRPMHEPLLDGAVYLIEGMRGGLYGTVSGHAANTFGVLFFLSLVFRDIRYTIVVMLFSIGVVYSRIYLGYHYPLDIFYGTVAGFFYGGMVYTLYKYITKKYIS